MNDIKFLVETCSVLTI